MNEKKPLSEDELYTMIRRFEEMQAEGRDLYLDAEQYDDLIEYYIYSREFEKAVEANEMGLRIHPDNTRLIAMRIALYIDEGKLEEAREMINTVIDEKAFPVRLIHAELLVMEGNEEEAGAIIDAFKKEDTDEIDCLDIGVLCNDLAFDEKAFYWLKKCLKINPENEEAILAICECYQNLHLYDETIPLYNKLIDKDPYSVECWLGLGRSYLHQAQLDKAIEACDFALVSNVEAGEAHLIKGHAYFQLENYQGAVASYKEACRLGTLEPELAPVFIAFGYVGMEDWENAYEYIKESIAMIGEDSPAYPDLLLNSARCLFYMDKPKEAHRTLDILQAHSPDNMFAYLYRGKHYLEVGDIDNAAEQFENAIELSPNTDTWYQIGVIAMHCEEYELAQNALETVRTLDPDYEDVVSHLDYVTRRLNGDNSISVSSDIYNRIKEAAENGESVESMNIEEYVRQAKEEGQSQAQIDELITALTKLKEMMGNYDAEEED